MKGIQKPKVGEIYKHYKGGRYVVLHISEDTNNDDGNLAVVYFSLKYRIVFHRDISGFLEKVTWPDGKKRSRFVLAV